MSARALLNVTYWMLVEARGKEEVDEMLTPVSVEDARADRLAQLQSLGVEVG